MVKITIDRPDCRIYFQGSPMIVAGELAAAIIGIYQGMNAQDPMDAELFKDVMKKVLSSDSPVWNDPH